MTFDRDTGLPELLRKEFRKFKPLPDTQKNVPGLASLPADIPLGEGPGGAFVHLARNATQSIASGGELLSWDVLGLLGMVGFTETVPTTTVTVRQAGYYNIAVQLGWDTFAGGGTITVRKNGIPVWPPVDDPGLWSADDGQLFEGTAHAIQCLPGDTLSVFVNPDDVSAQTLVSATFAAYLVDRNQQGPWELMFAVANFGITWDTNLEHWWTTDHTDDVDPALFERDLDGTVINSYAGYDTEEGINRNRSIVYAAAFLWGVGNEQNVHKVDPSDGSVVSQFTTGASGNTVWGIGYDGTNLFVIEQDDAEIREFNLTGTLQNTDSFPAGHELHDMTWDGAAWWATTSTQTVIKMNTAFAVVTEIEGPTGTNYGCHHKDGFLYVMTPTGLYRRAV